jgi:hypothetical protein
MRRKHAVPQWLAADAMFAESILGLVRPMDSLGSRFPHGLLKGSWRRVSSGCWARIGGFWSNILDKRQRDETYVT